MVELIYSRYGAIGEMDFGSVIIWLKEEGEKAHLCLLFSPQPLTARDRPALLNWAFNIPQEPVKLPVLPDGDPFKWTISKLLRCNSHASAAASAVSGG